DPRDDVYALGVIWYQMLSGDLTNGAPTGLWADDLEQRGMRRDLIQLLGQCVDPQPQKRPQDAGELAERLRKFVGPGPGPKPGNGVGPPPSNKEQVWLLWTGAPGTTVDQLHEHVGRRVKRETIVTWLSDWKSGRNLPAIARITAAQEFLAGVRPKLMA